MVYCNSVWVSPRSRMWCTVTVCRCPLVQDVLQCKCCCVLVDWALVYYVCFVSLSCTGTDQHCNSVSVWFSVCVCMREREREREIGRDCVWCLTLCKGSKSDGWRGCIGVYKINTYDYETECLRSCVRMS